MKKSIILFSLFPFVCFAGENSLNNVLNNNGSVGNVTINQSNSISNSTVESQAKIDEAMLAAYKAKNNQLGIVAEMANEVNKQSATAPQKNKLCKSKAEVGAEILGYKVDFAFGMCDKFFTAKN
ncbi:hypothetical protein [Vibrio vulnificus]|uniref:hypothetical protein n=1 Tax=Vibrio vulnificus TaxID=672 RepID=UPI000F4F0203|nr:hypothetical protein [Vibrio vulnificus]MCA3987361.1 hypothetical protein [Vibrio vulnificus]MCA3989868.1 hypothetical protein [Vibrio vulnificus]MCU8178689.1 hypothetical protein [Vibrio vulnificus]RPB36390.1 hypothetical protein CYV18_04660 [Vibrio vulnificus]